MSSFSVRYLIPVLALFSALSAPAHDIPADVAVQTILKPGGRQLRMLVRLPLKAMRDVDFPEQPGGYLDIDRLAPQLPDAATVWLGQFIEVYEDGRRLPVPRVAAVQISYPSDRSFASFAEALAHTGGPRLPNSANLHWSQAMLDVLFVYDIRSDAARFSFRPGLRHLAARVVVSLRFLPPGGAVRAYELQGTEDEIPLDPGWTDAFARFVRLGFLHILDGTDHLLFLACLVIPFRRLKPLVGVVTAFTLAHSITLAASAFGYAPDAVWFPPLIETLIAVSIVWMALENIVGATKATRRWAMAFCFGLVHGFGFSFALRETLQFAGSHLAASLLAFNTGVELGQLAVLALLVPVLDFVFRRLVAERTGTVILSAFVAHTGWHWMLERWDKLSRFRVDWLQLSLVAGAAALAAAVLLDLWLRRSRKPA